MIAQRLVETGLGATLLSLLLVPIWLARLGCLPLAAETGDQLDQLDIRLALA